MIAAAGPSAYWYLTRGTGTTALVLLTLSVALGVANVQRLRTANVPRFVVDGVHRNVSLLAVAFVVVHIITSVLDGFAPIKLIDAIVPFVSPYRPLWLGLGAVAFDLLIAVAVTSVLRRRFGYRTWRAIHWAAYASWPVALLHGLGTGSDTKAHWMLAIAGACVIVMVVALVARATAGWPEHPVARLGALAASAAVPLGLLVWLPSGPLAAGWAKQAGTPAALLTASATAAAPASATAAAPASATATGTATGGASNNSPAAPTPFSASANGTITQGPIGEGLAGVNISLTLTGTPLNMLAIELRGQPLGGGGIEMTSSEVTLGPASNPTEYQGNVTALEGTNLEAVLGGPNGRSLTLQARLQITRAGGSVTGTVIGNP